MHFGKLFVVGLLVAVLPAVAEEAADRKTATSLIYVTHELATRQNKFDAEQNKAMEYTNTAGDVQKRAVTSDLDNGGTESLPMVGGVNAKLNTKQDDIDPINDHTAVTYTGQSGEIGAKGIYQADGTYAEQADNLIDAKTFNTALKNGLDSEFICSEFKPDTNLCWVYSIHNNGMPKPYVSATGTATQDGTPTPEHPIDPIFYHQGNMILRRVGDYADSYDAATHKITRRVGMKVLDGTEAWVSGYEGTRFDLNLPDGIRSSRKPAFFTHFKDVLTNMSSDVNNLEASIFTVSSEGSMLKAVIHFNQHTLSSFKSWLAEQYAAGTPVTIWYPLATPTEEDWPDTTYNDSVYIPQNQ